MKNLLPKMGLLLVLFLGIFHLNAQETPPIYKEVIVEFFSLEDIENASKLGVDLDHFHPRVGKSKLIVSEFSLDILQEYGYQFEIIDEDVATTIEQRNIKDLADYIPGSQEKTTNGFTLGSMGGFYTYAEIVQKLDEMKTLYPNLITAKEDIGTSIEGRTIWAVKISDNPDMDESAQEAAVYYDALHHAREPASMAVVINYMFHLLENYGTDPEVTYLVDNREIFIVPIVNPDGYVYNQTTNPNGGGFWRKNRRNNSGSSCFGVDPNRNYDTDWSSPIGASSNPCSDSYRGTAPFSEPETQAIRDYTTAIGAPAAYTLHTFGGYYLGPDFSDGQQEFAIHAEINNDCLDENEYIYGDADILLGYASGTTQNWMYESIGSLSWTPEIGTVSFWAPISDIIPLVNEHVRPMQYLTWVVGALADYQGFTILNAQGLSSAENLLLNIELKNKGLSQTAENVSVTITTDNPDVTAVIGTQAYPDMISRTEAVNATPFEFSVAPSVAPGTPVQFTVQVSQDGVISNTDTFIIPVGERNVLFSDNAEGGSGNWSNSGSGTIWESSDEDAYTGNNCFVDSRLGHTAANNNRVFTLNNAVSLVDTDNPRLEFAAKWGLYATSDFVRLQISVNGSSWTSLSTPAMAGANAYFDNETWTFESIDLSAYIGQSVQFRFWSISGSSLRSDGFYFDDFSIVNYRPVPPTCSDGIQNGNETGVDCGGPDCAACPPCDCGETTFMKN